MEAIPDFFTTMETSIEGMVDKVRVNCASFFPRVRRLTHCLDRQRDQGRYVRQILVFRWVCLALVDSHNHVEIIWLRQSRGGREVVKV